jgi:peptidyl-tRNA hydrolase
MTNPVMYIFINKSLQMSAGKIGSQCAQVAVGSYLQSDEDLRTEWWFAGGHHTTLTLEARDETHIIKIERYLLDRGIKCFAMIDEGMTEIPEHTITCLAAYIVNKDDEHILKTFQSFKLYKDTIRATLEFDR